MAAATGAGLLLPNRLDRIVASAAADGVAVISLRRLVGSQSLRSEGGRGGDEMAEAIIITSSASTSF